MGNKQNRKKSRANETYSTEIWLDGKKIALDKINNIAILKESVEKKYLNADCSSSKNLVELKHGIIMRQLATVFPLF